MRPIKTSLSVDELRSSLNRQKQERLQREKLEEERRQEVVRDPQWHWNMQRLRNSPPLLVVLSIEEEKRIPDLFLDLVMKA